jgi:hypothetical protein
MSEIYLYQALILIFFAESLIARALTLDHINGDGATQRRAIRKGGGRGFYSWVKRNGYPKDLQVLCWNCQWIKRSENQEYAVKHK